MEENPPILQIVVALLIGAAGGAAFWALHLPLPWMLGAIFTTTIASVAGAPIAPPRRIRPAVIAVIGVLLGSGFTPELLGRAGGLAASIGVLVLYLVVAAALVIPFYRKVGGFDPVTAYYAAMPGGLTEMVLIGGEAGGNERKIILAHAARIFICVFLIAFWFRVVLGLSVGSGPLTGGLNSLTLVDAVVLILAAVIGYPLARVLRLPAPELLGPMILSAAAHLSGLTHIAPPVLLVVAAQIALGTMLGCRFLGTGAGEVGRALLLSFGATLITLLVALGAAALAGPLTGLGGDVLLLAYAPGGLSEMSLIALALKADVAIVAVQHIIRIVLVIAGAPVVFRLMGFRPL
jgi:uncharacterized protein